MRSSSEGHAYRNSTGNVSTLPFGEDVVLGTEPLRDDVVIPFRADLEGISFDVYAGIDNSEAMVARLRTAARSS